jgi:hypothetical protein
MWACVRLALIALVPVRTFSDSQKLEFVDNNSEGHKDVTGFGRKSSVQLEWPARPWKSIQLVSVRAFSNPQKLEFVCNHSISHGGITGLLEKAAFNSSCLRGPGN